jgi:hypothetical protein
MHARLRLGAVALGTAALALAAGVGAAAPTIAGAATPATKAATVRTLALKELKQLLSHVEVGAPVHGLSASGGQISGNTITKLTSENWSGYADEGAADSFTKVSGSWVEPKGKCTSTETLAAFWVGIDGISSSDPTVEQDGTLILCYGGTPYYIDWWETYPGNAIQVISESLAAGDHISAKVSYNGSDYAMSVTDSTTTSNSFSVTEPCGTTTCENLSAEWIAEAPTSSGSVVELADFGTWKATNARATYKGKSGSVTGVKAPTVDEITIVDSAKATQAQPSALSDKGATFSVVWKKSS